MSDGSDTQHPHLFREGAGPVLLMLHGTGGSEQQIASLAPALDPSAAVLAPRGRVVENGMLRWFRRHGEGVFDTASVIEEAAALAGFLDWARDRYALADRRLIAVGLSNGANIALATAMLHPAALTRVVAFSGMHPLPDAAPTPDLSELEVLLLNGSHDPMAPAASVDRLERDLLALGAQVDRRTRPGGHGIDQREADAARAWVARR